MHPLVALPLVVFGSLAWAGVIGIWRVSLRTAVYMRVILYLVLLVLYAVGYFALFVALGIDNWDDSSALYWDTWLLAVSTTALAAGYAITRLEGTLRAVLAGVPVVWLIPKILSYLTYMSV